MIDLWLLLGEVTSLPVWPHASGDGLLHVRLRHTRLGTRSKQARMSDDIVLVAVESISVAIGTCRNMTRNDGIAALANFKFPGRFNDFPRSRCALGKMTIGHALAITDCPSWLNGV